MKPDYADRVRRLRSRMETAQIDAALITEPHNIFYLCGSNGGYTGARICLIVDPTSTALMIDKRYLAEAEETAVADSVVAWTKTSYIESAEVVKALGVSRIGFESSDITVRQLRRLTADFKSIDGAEPVGVDGLVEPLREIKDDYELERITAAAAIGDAAFTHILGYIKPGITELDVAIELDYFMRKNGAERVSFDTIAASGLHSAVPHATPTNKKVEAGDFMTLDLGAVVDGYHSDMTRTVVVGSASERQKEIYSTVLRAQRAALEAVAPGAVCGDIDAVARTIIDKAGYADTFVHGLGHGVGLDVHESPTLSKGVPTELKPHTVVTVEPGIYINGFGGVRIEDLVFVTENGHTVATHSTKDLLEL